MNGSTKPSRCGHVKMYIGVCLFFTAVICGQGWNWVHFWQRPSKTWITVINTVTWSTSSSLVLEQQHNVFETFNVEWYKCNVRNEDLVHCSSLLVPNRENQAASLSSWYFQMFPGGVNPLYSKAILEAEDCDSSALKTHPLVQSLTDGNHPRSCLPFRQWNQLRDMSSRTGLQHPEPWSSPEGCNHSKGTLIGLVALTESGLDYIFFSQILKSDCQQPHHSARSIYSSSVKLQKCSVQ